MLKRTRGKRASHTGGVETKTAAGSHGPRGQTPHPLLSTIFNARTGLHYRGAYETEARKAVLNRLPAVLREIEFPCWEWKEHDKAFACEWLDSDHVVVGTKCNQLLTLSTATGKLHRMRMPPAPPRPTPVTAERPHDTLPHNCGIHALALSPDGQLLATGGANPADCQVLRVRGSCGAASSPTLEPVQTLVGHTDWVFGISWVTDRHVVTGSRDQCIKLWEVNPGTGRPNDTPLRSEVPLAALAREEKNYKVRDVKYNRQLGRLASLTTNGCVQLWDPHLTLDRIVKLKHTKEVVCMAMSDSVLAVGSQSHICLVDPRRKTPIQDVDSLDPGHGVRSLNVMDHLLSCGSGRGRLFFYDMRASAFLDLDPHSCTSTAAAPAASSCGSRRFLQCGAGYLNQNDAVYLEHFSGEQVFHACYSHAWDPSGTRLMAVGGPLAYGLRGCYMALWD